MSTPLANDGKASLNPLMVDSAALIVLTLPCIPSNPLLMPLKTESVPFPANAAVTNKANALPRSSIACLCLATSSIDLLVPCICGIRSASFSDIFPIKLLIS